MKPLELKEIRQAIHGQWLTAHRERSVQRVSTDTRTARAGDLFFALRGERFDGHEFLTQAAQAGCAAAVVDRAADLPAAAEGLFEGGLIGVGDTTKALGDLAAHHRGVSAADVVAVTGSNGKTTVKRMIHHILSRRLKGSCSPKSFNNAVGVPLTLLGVEPGDGYVVCELGTNAPGEIAALGRMARPDVAVITSLAPAHLGGFGSLQRIAAEKASLLESLRAEGLAVVWADSELLAKAVAPYHRRVVTFGQSESADLRLTGVQPAGRGQRFELNGRLGVDLPLPGRHNAMNALAAIAVAQRFGFEQEAAAGALADLPGLEARLEWTDVPGGTVINDAYNANPASLAAAADVLVSAGTGRKVLIAGDMRELGEQEVDLHLKAGRELAASGIDLVIGVGPLGRYIAQGAGQAGASSRGYSSCASAAGPLRRLLRPGDTVLIKGSRAAAMETLIEPVRSALGAAPRAKSRSRREEG